MKKSANINKSTIIAAAFFVMMAIVGAATASAQNDTTKRTLQVALHWDNDTNTANDTLSSYGDSCVEAQHVYVSIDLGLSAGTSFMMGNKTSPYYSQYGFTLQIPLLAHWNITPNWQLSTGLRYDFTWNPLYYNVELSSTPNNTPECGLQFMQTPTTATQNAYAYISHLGIPVELKWYPWAEHHNRLGLGVDFFVGYAVTRYFVIDNIPSPGIYEDVIRNTVCRSSAIQPWKLEMGFSINTDIIGLAHGIRLFTNILPTYKDPISGQKIYQSGITIFL